jgi:hypothetical protein
MFIPKKIVDRVQKGQYILFLGSMATAATPPAGSEFVYVDNPPGGNELSRRLAHQFSYPHGDCENLQRVSLFIQTQTLERRSGLVDGIFAELTKPNIIPSPALHMLAALPFRLIITTNYDHLFERALRAVEVSPGKTKDPIISIYDPNASGAPEDVPLDPLPERPVLLKLHGDIDKPGSIVITEEDYITFIYRMGNLHLHPIHEKIRARMMEWPLLFIGYSLRDLNLRLLLKTLRWNMDDARFPLSFSVDRAPDDLIVAVYQDGEKPILSFIKQDLWHFVPALYEACLGKPYMP